MDGVSKHALERALGAALQKGGDFSEIYLEDTRRNNLILRGGAIDTATTGRAHGAGVRVLDGDQSVYVYTCDTSPAGLLRAAKQVSDTVGESRMCKASSLIRSICVNRHAIARLPMDATGARKAELLRDADAAARAVDPLIRQVIATWADADTHVTIANSEGLLIDDRRVYTRMAVQAVAMNERENQLGTEAPGAMRGMELFEDEIDIADVARSAAHTAVTMLHAPQCPAGEMPVVIDGGFGGVIFHEACGHSLEATAVARGNSEFAGKLGMKIASDVVTAIDDGTVANAWGSINIDDEGMPTNKLFLIERGILKNYMIDRLNARRMGMPPTGSGRRQDYRFQPTSRMRNTYIAPGDDDDAEMIATMGDGLFAKKMGGGSVNPTTGEFNFAVAEGYLVRDGKIIHPVRGATLIGRGGEVLIRIDRVGKNMRFAQGMCGSSSGLVPVNVGQPMIRVSRLTVGGQA